MGARQPGRLRANTLLPYDASPAKDGTVAFGLQDNGSGHIEPDGTVPETVRRRRLLRRHRPRRQRRATTTRRRRRALQVTHDGGRDLRAHPAAGHHPAVLQPVRHGPDRRQPPADRWAGGRRAHRRARPATGCEVFNLDRCGQHLAITATELQGAAAYVGFCSICDIINSRGRRLRQRPGHQRRRGRTPGEGLARRLAHGRRQRACRTGTSRASRWTRRTRGRSTSRWRTTPTASGGRSARSTTRTRSQGPGHVFRSTDAGETFTDVSGNLPDVPARSIEVNRGQLLVGTDVGMFLSNNADGHALDRARPACRNVPVVSVKNSARQARERRPGDLRPRRLPVRVLRPRRCLRAGHRSGDGRSRTAAGHRRAGSRPRLRL